MPARPRALGAHAVPLTAAVASVALMCAGCGSSSPKAAATAGSGATDFVSQAYKYASCMRQHGVAGFPDPTVVHHGGETGIRQVVSSSEVNTPAFASAQNACKGLMPGGGPNAGLTPQQRQAREAHFLAFSQCMRSHHVPTFPDPTAQGQITPQMISAAGIDLQAPAVQSAAYACVPAAGGAITAADIHRALSRGG